MTTQGALHEISIMVYQNADDIEMKISKDCYKSIVSALEKQIEIENAQFTHICQSDKEIYPTAFSIYARVVEENEIKSKKRTGIFENINDYEI